MYIQQVRIIIFLNVYNNLFPPLGQDDSSDSNDDKDEESNEDESDSSDDTFVKDTYFSTSSVWRSYTTRRQAKGMKEGEDRLNTETGH